MPPTRTDRLLIFGLPGSASSAASHSAQIFMVSRARESIFRRDRPILTTVKFSAPDPASSDLSDAVLPARPSSRYCILTDERSEHRCCISGRVPGARTEKFHARRRRWSTRSGSRSAPSNSDAKVGYYDASQAKPTNARTIGRRLLERIIRVVGLARTPRVRAVPRKPTQREVSERCQRWNIHVTCMAHDRLPGLTPY
jgi:hypothetical protein